MRLFAYYLFPLAVFAVYYLLTAAPVVGFLEYHIPDRAQRRISTGLLLACVAFVLIVALCAYGEL